jgi:hypothetical protein
VILAIKTTNTLKYYFYNTVHAIIEANGGTNRYHAIIEANGGTNRYHAIIEANGGTNR